MKFKEKEINGKLWRVNQFTGSKSFKLLVAVLQRIGPGFSKLVSGLRGGQGSILNADLDPDALSGAVYSFVQTLDPEKDFDFIMRILHSTQIDGADITPESFDLIFQGCIMDLFLGVVFVLEVNYADFLGEGGLGRLLPKIDQTQTTSESSNN